MKNGYSFVIVEGNSQRVVEALKEFLKKRVGTFITQSRKFLDFYISWITRSVRTLMGVTNNATHCLALWVTSKFISGGSFM